MGFDIILTRLSKIWCFIDLLLVSCQIPKEQEYLLCRNQCQTSKSKAFCWHIIWSKKCFQFKFVCLLQHFQKIFKVGCSLKCNHNYKLFTNVIMITVYTSIFLYLHLKMETQLADIILIQRTGKVQETSLHQLMSLTFWLPGPITELSATNTNAACTEMSLYFVQHFPYMCKI